MYAVLPKTVPYGPVPQVEVDDQAKPFQMQAVATEPFCSDNCLQAGRGFHTSPSVCKCLVRSRVHWLRAALVMGRAHGPLNVFRNCCLLFNVVE